MSFKTEIQRAAIWNEVISAAKYYVGTPDGSFFKPEEFSSTIVYAPKAYITINTILGEEYAEETRFKEGKKQISEFFTKQGIERIIELYNILFSYGVRNRVKEEFTTRACRRSKEIETGMLQAFSSTTKNSISDIFKLGYGDKVDLAICTYNIHAGAAIFDMEALKGEYKKPEEREVLLLMGNNLESQLIGKSTEYIGRDGINANIYKIDVYPPES